MPDELAILLSISLIVIVGFFPVVNLIILLGCSSKLKDLSYRLTQLEKVMRNGPLSDRSPMQPEIRIQSPGTAEPKKVPGYLLANQPASGASQKTPGIRPEAASVAPSAVKPEAASVAPSAVKPEAASVAPSAVKPEAKPMPVHTEPPAQVSSPVRPEAASVAPSAVKLEAASVAPSAVKPEPSLAEPAAPSDSQPSSKKMMPERMPDPSIVLRTGARNVRIAGNKVKEKLGVPASVSTPEHPLMAITIEEQTAKAMKSLWQWLIVGEEYRKGGSKEYAAATTWLLRTAMLLLVMGLAYFIKYTHDHNLLPPELRLSIAALFTLGLLGTGCRLLKGTKYRIFGTALAGAGFAGLYLCVFASVSVYHLLNAWIGLAGLVVVTAAGVALALRFNTILLAVLAICGGYLAPILMDTGSRNFAGLFGYMLILVVGALVIARMRSWWQVNILSFFFTWGIYLFSDPFPFNGYSSTPYIEHPDWPLYADFMNRSYAIALAFGALFFLAFCVQTVAYNLYSKRKVTLLELGFAALNGIFFMSFTLPPTISLYGREYAAAITFGGALAYLLQIALLIRVKLEDRNLLLTLLVFSCGLISLTFPLLLNQDHLAVAWAVQATAMLYIACRTRSSILLHLSYIVYLIAVVRLLGFDLARGYWHHNVSFLTRLLNFGSCTAALAGGFFILKRYGPDMVSVPEDEEPRSVYFWTARAMFWGAFAVSFFLIVGEFTYLPQMKIPGIMVTSAVYLLILSLAPRLLRENLLSIMKAGMVLLFLFLIFLIVFWQSGGDSVRDTLWRLFPTVLTVAILFFAGMICGRFDNGEKAELPELQAARTGKLFITSAILLWVCYSTDETSFLFGLYFSRAGSRIAVSLLWGFYALALLAYGILRKKKIVRICALVLFAVTVLKIFIYDLAGTPALYRIAGCMITGAVLVAGAWLYARFAQKGNSTDESRS